MEMSTLHSVCRLCGSSEGVKFNIFCPRMNHVSKIHQLLPVMIHERDPWTKIICHRCAYKLHDFYEFRELCIKTDSYLKTQISWEPQTHCTPVTSLHAHIRPTTVQLRAEVSDGQPSRSPPPPTLLPEPPAPCALQPQRPSLPTQPPPLQPEVNFLPLPTQPPPPSPPPPTNVVFLNSEQRECSLPEEPEAVDSDSSVDDQDSRSCNPDWRRSNKLKVSTRTRISRAKSRKHNSTLRNAQGARKKTKTSRSHHESQVITVQTETQDHSKQIQNESHTPGTSNVASNAKRAEQNKVKRKPGPKSRVGGKYNNLDDDDDDDDDESDVEFVLYKPPNSVLDVIDMTDDIDSPVEEDVDHPSEGLAPHLTCIRIPGVCYIYVCSLCDITFTSKLSAKNHMCKSTDDKILESEELSNHGNASTDNTLSETSSELPELSGSKRS